MNKPPRENPDRRKVPAHSPHAPRLILASASPRRAELLREYGYDFDVISPPADEPPPPGNRTDPVEWAESVSLLKVQSVAALVKNGWILSGDTVAAIGDRIFGKPADRADAETILRSLAGTTHRVITGVTLFDAVAGRRLIRHDITRVTMRSLSDREIADYLDTDAWRGKAGAYGIQDRGDAFVERIDGSFTNVVGFPMELIREMLDQWTTM
ncbi:MAG: Maf family protein [Phycisphaerales bacterium]|nr:Maf family protein [Phycisphaerales bacterium]